MASAGLILLLVISAANGVDSSHGQTQLDAMFADRPSMSTNLPADHRLLNWVRDQFEGAGAGARVFWDGRSPGAGFEAEHTPPQPQRRASVRVRASYASGAHRGESKKFSDLWADLIYELHNLSYAPLYARTHAQVSAGDIGPGVWLTQLARGEHQALLDTADFYRTRWLPWMEAHPLADDARSWLQIFATETDFGRYMTRYQRRDGYPYRPLANYYERVLQSHRYRYQVDHLADPAALPAIHWRPPPYRPIKFSN